MKNLEKEKALQLAITKVQHFGMAYQNFHLHEVRIFLNNIYSPYLEKHIKGLVQRPINKKADDVMWLCNVLAKIGYFKHIGGQTYTCWKELPILTWEEAYKRYKVYLAQL